MPRFSSGERLVNSIDVIAMTGGGGFRAKMLLTDTLGSFHEMVRFSGPMRILVHDDPIYLKPLHQKGKGKTGEGKTGVSSFFWRRKMN